MEYTMIKIGYAMKWLIPAALGAGIAVWLKAAKGDMTYTQGFWIFVFGTGVSSVLGGFLVERYSIPPGSIQALIYMGTGIWGLGTIIQMDNLFPQIAKTKIAGFFGINVEEDK